MQTSADKLSLRDSGELHVDIPRGVISSHVDFCVVLHRQKQAQVVHAVWLGYGMLFFS